MHSARKHDPRRDQAAASGGSAVRSGFGRRCGDWQRAADMTTQPPRIAPCPSGAERVALRRVVSLCRRAAPATPSAQFTESNCPAVGFARGAPRWPGARRLNYATGSSVPSPDHAATRRSQVASPAAPLPRPARTLVSAAQRSQGRHRPAVADQPDDRARTGRCTAAHARRTWPACRAEARRLRVLRGCRACWCSPWSRTGPVPGLPRGRQAALSISNIHSG